MPDEPEAINREVVRLMLEALSRAAAADRGRGRRGEAAGERWPLGVASSSNRPLIDAVLATSGLAPCFRATVSSEEVPRGKPAPDVYLEAARRLGVEASACAAVEDSHSGIRSAKAAGMRVVAIPNPTYPPGEEALAEADVVLASLAELTPEVVDPSGSDASSRD